MSYADKVFINMCRDIIDNGTDTRGEKVRPVWEDGTPAVYDQKFGVVTVMICRRISGIDTSKNRD